MRIKSEVFSMNDSKDQYLDTSAIKLFDSKDQYGDMTFLENDPNEDIAIHQSTFDVTNRERTLVIDQGDIYNQKKQHRQVMSLCNFDDEKKIIPT